MYFLPLPLLFAGLGAIGRGSAGEMLGELGGFAGLMLGGVAAERGAEGRGGLRRPRRRPAAGGAAQAVRGGPDRRRRRARRRHEPRAPPVGALAFGVVAGAAHLLAFGLDPMRKKGLEGVDEFATDRVARAIDQAEELVRQTTDAAKRMGDRRLEGRLERLCDQAREVFRVVERDPRDLSRARTFLSVYLLGLRDATVKFAEVWSRSQDAGRGRPTRRCSATSSRASRPSARISWRTTAAGSTSRSRCCATG